MYIFNMDKIIVLGVMAIFLIGFASSYICIDNSVDNEDVKDFKININNLALQEDFHNGLTKEGLRLKLKYFGPCR